MDSAALRAQGREAEPHCYKREAEIRRYPMFSPFSGKPLANLHLSQTRGSSATINILAGDHLDHPATLLSGEDRRNKNTFVH